MSPKHLGRYVDEATGAQTEERKREGLAWVFMYIIPFLIGTILSGGSSLPGVFRVTGR